MTAAAPVRFAYRYVPWIPLAQWAVSALALIAFTIYVGLKVDWKFSLLPVIGTIYFAIRLGLVRMLILVVEDKSLAIIRRPLLHWFGSFETIPANQIRHVRYSLEVAHTTDSDGDRQRENHYRLDIITTDSRIVKIINSCEQPLPRHLAQNLAAALGAHYEEFLDALVP